MATAIRAQACLELTAGRGVDVVFDTIRGASHRTELRGTKTVRRVTILQPGSDTDWNTAWLRNQRISLELILPPMYFNWQAERKHQAWILEQCAELFETGELQVEVHRLIGAVGMQGKPVLSIA